MADIVSKGYDGSIDEVEWARLAASLGAEYGVLSESAWKVTAAAGDRNVQVAVSDGFGHGVVDRVTGTPAVVQGAVVASGSRWDTVVARRDWQPAGGLTTFAIVTGTATKAISAARLKNPGVTDEQPIALVKFAAGQSDPQEITDLRCWAGNGGLVAADVAALEYLGKLGTRVRIGAADYVRVVGAGGVPAWEVLSPPQLWQNNRVGRADIADEYGSELADLLAVTVPTTAPAGLYEASVTVALSGVSTGLTVNTFDITGPGATRTIPFHLTGTHTQTFTATVPFTRTAAGVTSLFRVRAVTAAGRRARLHNAHCFLDVKFLGS